jgi:hypothetical protein
MADEHKLTFTDFNQWEGTAVMMGLEVVRVSAQKYVARKPNPDQKVTYPLNTGYGQFTIMYMPITTIQKGHLYVTT